MNSFMFNAYLIWFITMVVFLFLLPIVVFYKKKKKKEKRNLIKIVKK